MAHIYRVNEQYVDLGSVTRPEDQLLRWVNQPGSGIRNMGGIRTLNFTRLELPVHAWILLITDERTSGSTLNPWHDSVDQDRGTILYWGDAKRDPRRDLNDFVGNRALMRAWAVVLERRWAYVPPFLHFSKVATSVIRFNGLCALEHLERTTFDDDGRAVTNYRARLAILPEPVVDLEWLRSRATVADVANLRDGGPVAWRRYQADGTIRTSVG